MTNVYVRTTGNDSTGTGATGAPYLTLKKALTVAVAGDYILLGDGAYAEDSGSGSLNITNAPASNIVIAPESGVPGKVIITGVSGVYGIILSNAQNLHFDAITFEAHASATTAAMRLVYTTQAAVRFTRCTFRARSVSGSTALCVASSWASSPSFPVNNFTWDSCTFEQIGPYAAGGMLLDNSSGTGVASNIRIQGCEFMMGNWACRLLGITNALIEDNRMTTFSPLVSGHAFQFGVDGATGAACSGVVSGNTFRTLNSHAAVIGAGCNGVLVVGNKFYGGDNSSAGQGLVVKSCQNVRIEKNIIHSGYLSGLYFKGATDCQAFDNIVYNRHATSAALRVQQNPEPSGTACARLVVRRNYFHATIGQVLNVGTSADDSGGSYYDENVYAAVGTATLGTVRGTSLTTHGDLRTGWAGYNRPNNDRQSNLGVTAATFAGLPRESGLFPDLVVSP